MPATYRITIDKYPHDDAGRMAIDPTTRTIIEANSTYRIDEDLAEWVKEEIDANAVIAMVIP